MINEKVSVKDFKELESDIRGIGLVEDLLSNLSQTELRYYYEENTELTLSLDNIKTVLTKYAANTENNRGISIINIRFNPGNYAAAILRREGQSLSAIVYATSSSVLLPYLLYYSGGTWTDILLASGRISANSTLIETSVPNSTWTTLRKITLTKGVWLLWYLVSFGAASGGGSSVRNVELNLADGQKGTNPINSILQDSAALGTRISGDYFVTVVTDTREWVLNAHHNSGLNLTVNSNLIATRLS